MNEDQKIIGLLKEEWLVGHAEDLREQRLFKTCVGMGKYIIFKELALVRQKYRKEIYRIIITRCYTGKTTGYYSNEGS